MALIRTKEIKEMSPPERRARLKELQDELMYERGVAAMGGAPPSPGKIRALRKNISRMLTVLSKEGEPEGVKETVKEEIQEDRG